MIIRYQPLPFAAIFGVYMHLGAYSKCMYHMMTSENRRENPPSSVVYSFALKEAMFSKYGLYPTIWLILL